MEGTQGTGTIAVDRGATTSRRRYRVTRLGLAAALVGSLAGGASSPTFAPPLR